MRKSEAINFQNLKFVKSTIANSTESSEGTIYIPLDKKLLSFSYPKLEKISEIEYTDEILDFHQFQENESEIKTILVAKSNKTITIYNQNNEKEIEYTHYKKITNSIVIEEKGKNYLLFSDKFGEIYIKKLNKENFGEPPKSLYGHSDPIHFMKISPSKNLIASADILGKIKICEFPNVFNFLSVLFYENEDVKFMDFFSNSDKELVVLNSKHFLHFWSMENFKISFKIGLDKVLARGDSENTGLVEIISIIPFEKNFIFVETKDDYFILEKVEDDLIKRKDFRKENLNCKSFFLEKDMKLISLNDIGEAKVLIDLN